MGQILEEIMILLWNILKKGTRSSYLAFEIFLQQGREGNSAGNSSFFFRGHLYFRRCPSTSSLLPYSMVSESCLILNHESFIKLKREPASSNCLKCRWETRDPTSRNSGAIFAVLKGFFLFALSTIFIQSSSE